MLWAKETLRVNLYGITGAVLKNTQERLKVTETAAGNLDANKVEAFYQSAPMNIRKAIEPFGYFKSTVKSELRHDTSGWIANFYISPGPALPITNVMINISGPGENDNDLQNLIKNFPLKPGQTLLIEKYNEALQNLSDTANNKGYIKSFFDKKELRIDLKRYSAEIIIHFKTGEKYYFGPVKFGQSPFAPDFLQRFIHFQNPEPFSSEKLLKLQQDLSSSQYFQQVLVNPDFNQIQDYRIPIEVDTLARKSQQYNAGIGWGTFTGPRFTAGFDMRRVTDTGQHFNTQIKLSPVLKGVAAKYFIPGKNPLSEQYTIGANFQEFIPRNGKSFSEILSGSYVRSVNEWQNTLSLNYLRERFTINDQPWTSSNLLYPSLSVTRIKTDDLINPRSGSAVSVNIQGANQQFLSQIDFAQTELKGKFIYSPFEPSRIILRGNLGYTVVKDLQKLPMTLQFFAGGPNSVRGYRYDSMGPGRYLKVASAEYQHRIYDNWSGALFYDAGIASDHFNSPSQHSRGVGIVYNSVIGPIKLYLSRADSSPGRPYRVDLNIGPDF